MKYALSAAKRAVEQFGEDVANKGTPIADLYNRIQSGAADVDEDAADRVFINDAAEQQKKRRWLQAAKAYLKVPKEKDGKPVRLRANAEANAGYCFFKAFTSAGTALAPFTAWRGATRCQPRLRASSRMSPTP